MEHKPKRKHFKRNYLFSFLLLKDTPKKTKRKGDIRLRISRHIENEAVHYTNES